MRYIGLYAWAIVFAIFGFNMFPEIMAVWCIAIPVAGFLDRKYQRKRQKKKEIEEEIEHQHYLLQFARERITLYEDTIKILGIDGSKTGLQKAMEEELEISSKIQSLESELKNL